MSQNEQKSCMLKPFWTPVLSSLFLNTLFDLSTVDDIKPA